MFRDSIKRFIVFWIGTVVLSCFFLAGLLLYVSTRLEYFTIKLMLDSLAKESTILLSNAVLDERHAEFLWRLTGDENFEQARAQALEKATTIIVNLDITSTTMEEEVLIDRIADQFRDFSALAIEPVKDLTTMTKLTDSLLLEIETLRELNQQQMEATNVQHQIFTGILHRWLVLSVILLATVVLAGSIALTRRILVSIGELSGAAAKFQQGEFDARAQIRFRDELGTLSRFFNDMAQNIETRERMRHEFIAAVFHDLKNPIVNVGCILNLLIRKNLPADQVRIWHERILLELARIDDLAQDLTDTVQVETGRLTLNIQVTDLTCLVGKIHREQSEVITKNVLEFEPDEPCLVSCDPRRIERVIINLISNSVKYSPEKTTITLRTGCRDGKAVFSITDRGIGISEEDRKLIFQPFGRLSVTRSIAQGTGLGLYIVKKIIEAHGGAIRLESSRGVGTTVEFTLLLLQGAANQQA